jgi:nitroreductase/lysophospholipase L1-like esterase
MKKTILSCIWLAAVTLGCFTARAQAPQTTPPAEPVRIACVGNSITYGAGLKHRDTDAYPAVMQRLLGDGFEVRNFGHSARTLLTHGDKPFVREAEFRDALAFLPNIVTIKLGTNDSKPWNWQYKDEFIPDMEAMIDSFQALPTHPQVYLCLPIPALVGRWGITDSIISTEVIPQIRAVAEKRHLPLIDLYTPLKPYPELLADSIHPNRAGACIIAEEIVRRLQADGDTSVQNAVIATIMARRSVRKYTDQAVPREQLQLIAECGVHAPNGMNKQPWAVRIVDQPEYINGITALFKAANPKMAEDPDFKNMFRNAPAVIFVAAPGESGQLDCGLLGENMILTAQSLGLGTCCLGGPIRFMTSAKEAAPYLQRLDLPEGYNLLYALAVGYPDEQPEAKPRDLSKIQFVE